MTHVMSGWYLSAAGIGTSPTYTADLHMTRGQWDELASTFASYVQFAPLPIAAPINAYGVALDAAGMSIVPVQPSSSSGIGNATLR
jgi:hypothetical protein